MGSAILLIEDDQAFAKVLSRFLAKEGYEVAHAPTGEDGVRLFGERTPDLVLLDLVLPGIDGLETLRRIREQDEGAAVIVMSAHGSVSVAVDAMRLGAADFMSKPMDLEALAVKLAKTQELIGLKADLNYVLDRERSSAGFHSFIGSSEAMQAVYDRIREVAKTDSTTVLVTGPSGTGKELTARAIHAQSARSKKPLMQIDCTAIPLTLLESELFGHERGAFTGADRTKKGLLELADGGTLFLDEIGDMDLGLQSKFLRVLQERQFRRIGGSRDLTFDVRVIAATNQDLEQLSAQGQFRRDLMYRLKVFQIELPPLRERGDDVVQLARAFVEQYAKAHHKPVSGLEPEAEALLAAYPFPGNVRELRNVIEQAVILSRGELIAREQLAVAAPSETAGPDAPAATHASTTAGPALHPGSTRPGSQPGGGAPPVGGDPVQPRPRGRDEQGYLPLALDQLGQHPLEAAERELIRQAMEQTGGRKKHAAELLGISRFALQRRLERMALESLKKDRL